MRSLWILEFVLRSWRCVAQLRFELLKIALLYQKKIKSVKGESWKPLWNEISKYIIFFQDQSGKPNIGKNGLPNSFDFTVRLSTDPAKHESGVSQEVKGALGMNLC